MSQKIRIPFKPNFKYPMLAGIKVCTARTKRMGEPGDTFEAFGATFKLVRVEDRALWEVKMLWKEEGCLSEDHFIEIWVSIHPKKGYDDYQRVYLHRFKRIL